MMGWLLVIFLSLPTNALAGIAANYLRDAGIGADPAVIFSENFESALATWRARFNGGAPAGIQASGDHSTASGGVQSALLIPNSSAGTLAGQLYTQLPNNSVAPQNYSELYMRYYVKYLGNNSHHAGAYLGGYSDVGTFPQGDAGVAGCRASPCLAGTPRLFIASFEQRGGDGINVPMTHIGTYNQWFDQPCAAGFPLCFGRDMLVTENQSLNLNTWQCMEMRVKVNTTASGHEGELQYWVNDTQVQNFTNGTPTGAFNGAEDWQTNLAPNAAFAGLRWRDVLTYGLNWIKLQNYSDGGTPFNVMFDDLVVATARIGCINTNALDTTPPAPPTGVRISTLYQVPQ